MTSKNRKIPIPEWRAVSSLWARNRGFFGGFGAPGGIRTHGLPLRRRSLYPTELRVHVPENSVFSRVFRHFIVMVLFSFLLTNRPVLGLSCQQDVCTANYSVGTKKPALTFHQQKCDRQKEMRSTQVEPLTHFAKHATDSVELFLRRRKKCSPSLPANVPQVLDITGFLTISGRSHFLQKPLFYPSAISRKLAS